VQRRGPVVVPASRAAPGLHLDAELGGLGEHRVQSARVVQEVVFGLDDVLGQASRLGEQSLVAGVAVTEARVLAMHDAAGDVLDVAAQPDVHASATLAGHRDPASPARVGDDPVLHRVRGLRGDQLVVDLGRAEHAREHLGFEDRPDLHEHRPSGGVLLHDVSEHALPLLGGSEVVARVLDPLHPAIARDEHDVLAVVQTEHGRTLGAARGAGHARPRGVAEEVDDGHRVDRAGGSADFDALGVLDGLLQPVAPAPAGQRLSVLVDDRDESAVRSRLDDVVPVLHDGPAVCEGVLHPLYERRVPPRGQVLAQLGQGLDELDPFRGELDAVAHEAVVARLPVLRRPQLLGDLRRPRQILQRDLPAGPGRGEHVRGQGLVEQDQVDLVDDPEPTTVLVDRLTRPVAAAERVEHELRGGSDEDVGPVRPPLGEQAHLRRQHVDAQPELRCDRPQFADRVDDQLGVERQPLRALGVQRPDGEGQRGREGLALAGQHLDDVAVDERQCAFYLVMSWCLPVLP
jgi:hypothetical protein